MKNNIIIPNIYKDISLGNGDTIREYESLDLKEELNSETQIIAVQKSVIKDLDGILEKMGIRDKNDIPMLKSLGRSGFTKIISKEYGQLGIIATKGSESTESFSNISNYFMGGNDIGNKIQANGVLLNELSNIPGEILWKCKTELLLLIGLNTLKGFLDNGGDISNFDVNLLTTKFTPTLTKNAIDMLPNGMLKPDFSTVDSNSELDVQILELLDKSNIVGAAEIVQSGKSLIATNNAVVKDGNIIMPSFRNKQTGEFEGNIISELDPSSQVFKLAEAIQTEINVIFYEILGKENNKPKEFINAIQGIMKNI